MFHSQPAGGEAGGEGRKNSLARTGLLLVARYRPAALRTSTAAVDPCILPMLPCTSNGGPPPFFCPVAVKIPSALFWMEQQCCGINGVSVTLFIILRENPPSHVDGMDHTRVAGVFDLL